MLAHGAEITAQLTPESVKEMYPDLYRGALTESGVAEIFLARHRRSGELIQSLTPFFYDLVRDKPRRSRRVVRNSPPPLGWPRGSRFPSSGGVPGGRGGSADFVAVLQSVCRQEPRQSRAGHVGSYALDASSGQTLGPRNPLKRRLAH